ncbi:MAG: lysylphosphatidylglycerol synthase transmembrane domain-containing protein [Phototrophicaceae bacterium]
MDNQPDTSPTTPPARARRVPWSLLLTLGLALLLLVLAFRGVDWGEMWRTLRGGNLAYLLVGFGFYTLAYLLRALRWRVLLSAEQTLPALTVFWATCAGYLGNNFLPARAGELIRTALLAARSRISASYVLATALTERIVDAGLLVLIVLGALSTMDNLPDWMPGTMRGMALVGGVGLAGLFIAPRLHGWILGIVERLPLPPRFNEKLRDLLEQFLFGMRSVQNPGRALSFLGITLVLWIFDGLAAMAIAAAFGLELSLLYALLILAALGLSSALPSTPGYVGIYQFVAVTVMEPLGFTRDEALVFVIALQAVIYAITIVWGGLGLWRLNMGIRNIRAVVRSSDAPPAPGQ